MITQEEYNYIISLKKEFKESKRIDLDKEFSSDIIAIETRDTFILDYHIGTIDLKKFTYNKRYKKTIILLRFDSSGRHTNPDGQIFDGPHVHIYKEGYDDKFAFPVSKIDIDENNINKVEVLRKFLQYCNVVNCPPIQGSIF